MTRPFAALVAVLAATAAGCGAANQPSQDFSAAEEDVAEVVEELQSAAQKDEATRICTEILSTELSRRLGEGCTDTIQTAIDDTDIFELGADSVRITGDRARVRLDVGRDEERQEQLEMVREAQGGWRIDRFGGVVE
jgi:hypothetical protein